MRRTPHTRPHMGVHRPCRQANGIKTIMTQRNAVFVPPLYFCYLGTCRLPQTELFPLREHLVGMSAFNNPSVAVKSTSFGSPHTHLGPQHVWRA